MTAIKSALEDFRTVIGLVRPLIPEWEPAAMLAGIDAAEAEVLAASAAPLDAGPEPTGEDVLALLAGLAEPGEPESPAVVFQPQSSRITDDLPVWAL